MNSLTINQYRRKALLAVAFLAVMMLLLPIHVTQAGFIGELIYEGFVVNFLGSILWLAGLMLNYAINEFVLGFGSRFLNDFGSTVDLLWSVVRDIFNLTFIFGLVYIGFKMILRSDDSSARKWLVQLILAALLVNFSLFITKFVIDFSNILAVEIVNLGIAQVDPRGAQVFVPNASGTGVDMAGRLQRLMSMPTTFSENNDAVERLGEDDSEGSMFFLIFGTAIVFLVSTFVFFSAAILLIIRAVVLIILMILSPFLFIGWVLPNLRGVGSKLWKILFSRAFFAPVYIAFLFITFTLAGALTGNLDFQNFSTALGSSDAVDASNAANDTFGPFIIITVLMITSLVAAQKMGVEGASSAIRVGKRMSNGVRRYSQRKAGDVTFGGAAKVGRQWVGGRASRAANSSRYKQLAKADGIKGWYGRERMKTAKSLADRSFDGRNVGGLGKATGLGTGKKGGFDTRQKEREKRDEEMSKWIGTRETEGVRGEIDKVKKQREMGERAELHAETKNMTPEEIDTVIARHESQQKQDKAKIRQAKMDGLPQPEVQELQDNVDINEKLLEQAKKLKAEKEEIAALEAQANEQPRGSATQIGLQNAIQAKQNDIADRGTEYLARGGMDPVASTQQNQEALSNEVRFQDQLEYREVLKAQRDAMQKIADVLTGKSLVDFVSKRTEEQRNNVEAGVSGGTFLGAGALGATLGVGGIAGMGANFAAGLATSNAAYGLQQSIDNLEKQFGRTAAEMARKDKETKARKQFVQSVKDDIKDGGSPGGENPADGGGTTPNDSNPA